jgi:hypothetical protein
MGVKVEMEHVNDKEKQKNYSRPFKIPDYYSRLDKWKKKLLREKSADITENTKTLIKRLLR